VSAGHHHGGAEVAAPRRVRLVTALVAGALAALAVGLLVVLWPEPVEAPDTYQPFGVQLFDAHITDIEVIDCPGDGPVTGQPGGDQHIECTIVTIEIDSGPDDGDRARINYVETVGAPHLEEGDQIVAGYSPEAAPEFRYYFADFQRRTPLRLLTLLFVVAVLLLGRWHGLRALIAAAGGLVLIVTFLIPALLAGTAPVVAALVTASAVAVLALYLTHGVNHATNVAFLGTMASLALTAALAAVFVAFTHLTGLAEDVTFLQLTNTDLDVTGLLLAGIVIGALGVLDDVTVTQVAAVWELHAADPSASAGRLYRSALRIGRDHIASTVNTLVLAYVGAALPLLLLFEQGRRPLGQVLTGEAIATEIVRALVGSIGLVASVPITTGLAVAVIGAHRDPDEEPSDPEPEPETPTEPPVPTWEDFTPEERTF
jgi:uncharacterized membrane protein